MGTVAMSERESRNTGPVITKEKSTVEKMVHIWCSGKHDSDTGQLCTECQDFLAYSHKRLNYCQFGDEKPTCRKCTVHCYNSEKRATIRSVMRYSGPRLIFKTPVEWIRHRLHERD
ncbi:MAG: nitrous oxide-stimulated promoter family protein [Candidatus Thorarchaeota archaeon]